MSLNSTLPIPSLSVEVDQPMMRRQHPMIPKCRRRSGTRLKSARLPMTNIIILSIVENDQTDDEVKSLCERYGEIESFNLENSSSINDNVGDNCTKSYQIAYKTVKMAQLAHLSLNGTVVNGKKLQTQLFIHNESPKQNVQPGAINFLDNDIIEMRGSLSILVKLVAIKVDKDALMKRFSQFGDIESFKAFPKNSSNLYSAKITYKSYDSSFNAFHEMNNQVLIPGTNPIQVEYTHTSRVSKRRKSMISNESIRKSFLMFKTQDTNPFI